MRFLIVPVALFLIGISIPGQAARLWTNSVLMPDAPKWLSERRLEKVVDGVQDFLEWDIRRVTTHWYSDQAAFEKVHGMGSGVRAVSRRSDNSIHLGPLVNEGNFDSVFGHELAHIILFQKYREAIPKWLEEGLANYAAKRKVTDYAQLNRKMIQDVRSLVHPFKGGEDPTLHYMASTALMEMIASKCKMRDLLQLSVGKNLENYLSTFCQIKDLNAEYKAWVDKKAK